MDNCKQIQKMIKDYDKGNLSLKQEEQFIHIILKEQVVAMHQIC